MALELQRKGYPKKPRLTEMQIMFFSLWAAEGYNPSKKRKCMDLAGYSGKTPHSIVIDSERVTKNFKVEMQAQGLSVVKMVEKTAELMDAKHANPKFIGEDGKRAPDNKCQRETLEFAAKMAGVSQVQRLQVDKNVEVHHAVTFDKVRQIEKDTGESLLDEEEKVIDLVPEDEDGETEDTDIRPL